LRALIKVYIARNKKSPPIRAYLLILLCDIFITFLNFSCPSLSESTPPIIQPIATYAIGLKLFITKIFPKEIVIAPNIAQIIARITPCFKFFCTEFSFFVMRIRGINIQIIIQSNSQ